MYIPRHYKIEDPQEIRLFIETYSFATLIGHVQQKLWATHLPLEWDTDEQESPILSAHMARANPQWKNFEYNSEVMAIFQGPHAYISSSWYDHENVPTWNYMAVHVYGKAKIFEGERLLRALKKIVDKYEANSSNPTSIENYSEKFLNNMLNGLVGIEISIEEIQAAYKLSQKQDHKNIENIAFQLNQKQEADAKNIAEQMIKYHPK